MEKVALYDKSYFQGGHFDMDGLIAFTEERIAEADRGGRIMLGVFPFTSRNLFQTQEPSVYSRKAEPEISNRLRNRRGVALCIYRFQDLADAGGGLQRTGEFLVAVMAHSTILATSGGRLYSGREALSSVLNAFDPDAVPTEVLLLLDPEMREQFNRKVRETWERERRDALEVLARHPDVIGANPGKVFAVLVQEGLIAGIAESAGPALEQAVASHGRRRFVIVRTPPEEPMEAF